MTRVSSCLIGRESEVAAVHRFLDGPDGGAGVLVLAGAAGVGKTTIWLTAVEAAVDRGFRVLSSRPSEAEARLAYAGLADLLADAVEVIAELPAIQRRALAAALLLGEPDFEPDDRAVAAAFLGVMRVLADERPLCLAVDDIQWLDSASLVALRFALGRLERERVSTLLAVRDAPPPWLRRAVPEARLETIEIQGLSLGATQGLLRERLGVTFPRPVQIKLWETSGGNPFFALELGGALRRRGSTLAPGEALPIPSGLDELLQARLESLGPEALELARAAAALSDPTVSVLESVVGDGADAALAEAIDTRILVLDGERARLSHPLLGPALARHQTPARRRALHSRLATFAQSAEERARHLALATAEPDVEIAAALEKAARSARRRGAPTTAAELAEQASRLTPGADVAGARRRLLLAADGHDVAGDTERAIGLLERALELADPGPDRATVLVKLADVQHDPRTVIPIYHRALEEANGDDALEATIQIRLAWLMMAWGDGAEASLVHVERAVAAASRIDDVEIWCRAVAARADWQLRTGHGIAREALDEAALMERTLETWPLESGPSEILSRQLVLAAEVDSARPLLEEELAAQRARDDINGEASAIWWLAHLEWRAGNWETAERHAAESLEIWTQLGAVLPPHRYPTALVAAHRGHVEEAREQARLVSAQGEELGIQNSQSGSSQVLGFVELSLGDAAAALPYLNRSYELRHAFMLEPAQRLELGDLLEALVATGDRDRAREILADWEPRAIALERAWSLAILARCRALLLAAEGDLDGAFITFDQALGEHAGSTDPFQHARTLLALGRTERRAKRRAKARATLEDALARFEQLGAPLWAEQARAELARIGGRAPSRDELTASERRIAALVAEGRTNRGVAAALFLTERSVETTLSRIYRKLGVHSRTELANRWSKS